MPSCEAPQAAGAGLVVSCAETPAAKSARWAALVSAFSAMPWWLVSVCIHLLAIVLVGLISFAVSVPKEDVFILVTDLSSRATIHPAQDAELEIKFAPNSALIPRAEIPPTDPTSKEEPDATVIPEIVQIAKLSMHDEAPSQKLPDGGAALGDIDVPKVITNDHGGSGTRGKGGELSNLKDVANAGSTTRWGTDRFKTGDTIGFGTIRRTDGRTDGGGLGGGGTGTGTGNGTGVGDGSGLGGFGNRDEAGREALVKRHGGSKETEDAVNRGLAWLARAQLGDGHWEPRFDSLAMRGVITEQTSIATTGFALLAFLGAGHTEKAGKYQKNVQYGIEWLRKQQAIDGTFARGSNYAQAIAGMALAEAAGMAKVPSTVAAAQRAVDASAALRVKYASSELSGWSYGIAQLPSAGGVGASGDMSNSGWTIMFMKAAKTAGLNVPENTIEGIHRYLNASEYRKKKDDPYSGHRYGYSPMVVKQAEGIKANRNKIPGDLAESIAQAMVTPRCTAIGLVCRIFFHTPVNELEGGVEYMIKTGGLPGTGAPGRVPGAAGTYMDLYYIYYGTLVAFNMGGATWDKWNAALQKTLLPAQIKGGANDGSWTPAGEWSQNWGRTGETALAVLSLEVFYRYGR